MKIDSDRLFEELHSLCGICGHCGKKFCAGKNSHSQLPANIPLHLLSQAIKNIQEIEG